MSEGGKPENDLRDIAGGAADGVSPESVGELFGKMQRHLSNWDANKADQISAVCPFILARICEVAGISLPGQEVVASGEGGAGLAWGGGGGGLAGGGGGGGGLAGSGGGLEQQMAVLKGLNLLNEVEKASQELRTPSMLTTPGSLRALRSVMLALCAQAEQSSAALAEFQTAGISRPLDSALALLERLALTPRHGAPRAILHARLLPVAIAAALGRGTGEDTPKETKGGQASLNSMLSLFNEAAGVYFEPRGEGSRRVGYILRRGDAALLVHCLVEEQEDMPDVKPILPRLAPLYRWRGGEGAAAAATTGDDGGSSAGLGRLLLPSAPTLWFPRHPNVRQLENHPALLRDLVAGPGMSIFVSHLCALAMGHWRQWGDRYGAAPSPAAHAAVVAAADPVPSNWPFYALQTLIEKGSLLHLYSAALAAMLQAPEAYALEEAFLVSLLLALARVLRVLRIDHDLTLARARAGGGAYAPPPPQTLLTSTLPLLVKTTLGSTLAEILGAESKRFGDDPASSSDSLLSALLACISALDECEQCS